MSPPYQIVPLTSRHDRSTFDCGVEPLTRYLHERAGQDMRNSVAVCYVVCAANSTAVLAYATLSAATIELSGLPSALARRLPRYPLLPAALIGRLAVDLRMRRQGLGELILMDMLKRCLALQTHLGLMAVVVDAKDERAIGFYTRYGFQPLTEQQQRLFLPIATIRSLFSETR